MDSYQKKIDFALKLLRSIPQDGEIALLHSGGKDSDVIFELAIMSGIKFRPIYKLTTLDPPGTYMHVKSKGIEIMRPKKTFFELIRQKGVPTLFRRYCCEFLKEYKVSDREILGVRRAESSARAERYKEPEKCREYSKKDVAQQYYPILDWTDEDIERFIQERGIKCHPLYYDDQGNFHVERRLGCIGCPISADKNRLSEFRQYPKLLKLYIKNAQIYLDTHKHVKAYENYNGDAYKYIFQSLFYKDDMNGYYDVVKGGLFPETAIDCKAFLEDYFKIDLTI